MPKRYQLPAWAAPLIDRAVAAIVTAVIAWFVGVMQGQKHSENTIKKLDADVANLEAGVDYFRK